MSATVTKTVPKMKKEPMKKLPRKERIVSEKKEHAAKKYTESEKKAYAAKKYPRKEHTESEKKAYGAKKWAEQISNPSQINKNLKKTGLTLLALGAAFGGTFLAKKAIDLNNLSDSDIINKYEEKLRRYNTLGVRVKMLLKKLNNNVIDEFKNIQLKTNVIDAIFNKYKNCKYAKTAQKTIVDMISIVIANMDKINLVLDDLNTIYNNSEITEKNFGTKLNLIQKQQIINEISLIQKHEETLIKIIAAENVIEDGIRASQHDMTSIRKALDAKDLEFVCTKEFRDNNLIISSRKM
jgi:hypothetical protein